MSSFQVSVFRYQLLTDYGLQITDYTQPEVERC